VRRLLPLLLLLAASPVPAQDYAPIQGLDPGAKPYQDLFKTPADSVPAGTAATPGQAAVAPLVDADPTRGDRCMEMSRRIEQLQGRPLQRSALAERYQQECALH
jgi:hypothetical protein